MLDLPPFGSAGIDDTVLQIARTYNILGQIQNVTSYNAASGCCPSGDVVNDIQYQYNGFGQVIAEYQSHSGPVNISSTPAVQYSYANGSANTTRLAAITYPSGGDATYNYGTSGEDGDMLSRVQSISFGSTSMVEHTYLGLKTFVQTEYPQPAIRNDLAFGTGVNPHPGLDNFGRVIDCRWRAVETGDDVERIQYGYDRASNRLWRHNTVAPSGSGNDELYTYDGLYRLVNFQRGELSPEPTSGGEASYSPTVTGSTITQQWSLDATGNWSGFVNSDALNPSDSVNQTRTHTQANEIVSFAASYGAAWAQPEHDAAGNMIVFPQPASPTYGFTATYDAWNRQVSIAGVSAYAYDGTNRRITKTVGNTVDDYYYSSNWQVLEDRQTIANTPQPTAQFIWGQRYVDDLVCRVIGSENLYALQDANWNVTAIIDYVGALQERYRYQAYGTPEFLLPSFDETSAGYGSFAWETLYASYRFDPELGTYQARNRELNPLTGIWLTRDSAGYVDGASLYAYASSSPLGATDPRGLAVFGLIAEYDLTNQLRFAVLAKYDFRLEVECQCDAQGNWTIKVLQNQFTASIGSSFIDEATTDPPTVTPQPDGSLYVSFFNYVKEEIGFTAAAGAVGTAAGTLVGTQWGPQGSRVSGYVGAAAGTAVGAAAGYAFDDSFYGFVNGEWDLSCNGNQVVNNGPNPPSSTFNRNKPYDSATRWLLVRRG